MLALFTHKMSQKTVCYLVRKLQFAMLAVKKCDHSLASQCISLFVVKMSLHPAALRELHVCAVEETRTQESPKSPPNQPLCPRSGIVWKRIWTMALSTWLSVIWGSTNAVTRPAPLRAVNTRGLRATPTLLWLCLRRAAAPYQRLREPQGGSLRATTGLCPIRASHRSRKMVRTNSSLEHRPCQN